MSLNENLRKGQKVKLLDGPNGLIKGPVTNFGFPMWEIQLENGKIQTEARYRFDVIEEQPTTPFELDECEELFLNEMNIDYDHLTSPPSPLPPTPPSPKQSTSANKPIKFNNNARKFAPVNNNMVDEFITEQQNKSTAKKTLADMRTLRQFLNEKEENRDIQNIPPAELNELLSQYFYSVRKSDGTEYEPSSLRGMVCSFDRYLKRHDYGFEICGKRKDFEFARTREVLKSKQIQLKKQGKGNYCHKADALSDEDIDALFRTGELGLSKCLLQMQIIKL